MFRIGSITKTMTVYALLVQDKISLDIPITKMVPELLHAVDDDDDDDDELLTLGRSVDWQHVTLRQLASQLGGIGRGGTLAQFPASRFPSLISGQ